ncbi:MAG: AAA family ATPase [Candidatus Aminicenantes bacterium]|nr:AAA family ATPase [Candidatus Aminicenantes bacterium]
MILAIANQKGGVGKTTTAFNLSSALALIGKSTLLVDVDPQAHSTVSIVNNSSQFDKSIYDVLVDSNVKIRDVIVKSSVPGLEIAISKIAMAKLEPVLLGEIDGHFRLRDVIEPIKKRYEFIIIDTPPTLGLITINALVAATHIIIPIQSSYLSLEGTDDLLETVIKIRKNVNPNLQVLGVLITIHDRRTNISRDAAERIKRVFGKKVFKTMISKSVKLEESPAYRESIFTYAPDSVGAIQYKKLAEEVIKRAKS